MPKFTSSALYITAFTALVASVRCAPADFQQANAQAAQQLNAQFAAAKATDACTSRSRVFILDVIALNI